MNFRTSSPLLNISPPSTMLALGLPLCPGAAPPRWAGRTGVVLAAGRALDVSWQQLPSRVPSVSHVLHVASVARPSWPEPVSGSRQALAGRGVTCARAPGGVTVDR